MLNPYLYNICNIWDIQLQHHITNFLQRINNPDLLGTTTRIRLQQLQNNLWSTINILQHPQPIINGPNRFTLNFKIIQLLTHLKLSVTANSNILWPHTIQHNLQLLEKILITNPKYKTFKYQLRKLKLLYLEQLCTADNTTLLIWKHLSPRLLHLPKGKEPLWFQTLESIVLENTNQRSLYTQFQQQGINIFAYNTCNMPKRSKPWLLSFNNNEIIIGKIRTHLTKSNKISITHWQININTDNAAYY